MEELREYLENYIDNNFIKGTVSNCKNKALPKNLKIKSVIIKEKLCYQLSYIENNQAFHKNYNKKELINDLIKRIEGNYKQLSLEGKTRDITMLISKKGKISIVEKKHTEKKISMEYFSHNRQKQYLLKEGEVIPFLVDLNVMTKEGKIVKGRNDKFKQINRFLEFIEDIYNDLPSDRTIKIVDFGCGKSYLTFAVYYYLNVIKKRDVEIIGLDLKKQVIENCNLLAKKYGYNNLHFICGDIKNYNNTSEVDMVISLHACDTATDYALYKAITWKAKVILLVPCCQHEVNKTIKNQLLEPVLSYGILKERISALLTDGLRGEILKSVGYNVDILEFIDMEHTPKNILIRGIKGNKNKSINEVREILKEFNTDLTLRKLLEEREGEN